MGVLVMKAQFQPHGGSVMPILAEIEQVDFETNTAVFKLPMEARVVAGKYWLVPQGDYVIVTKDALIDGGGNGLVR
jgi:hypothetical protein